MTDTTQAQLSGQGNATDSTPVNAPNTGSEGSPASSTPGGEGQNGEGKTPWYIKVIAQRAHEAREARREANSVRQELETLRQQPSVQPVVQPQNHQAPPVDVDRLVNERLAQREFDKACNDVWEKGNKEIPGFRQSLDNTFGVVKMTPGFLQTVVALQEPHKILHTLANNPEEAHRIMSLNAQAQAIELARLENKVQNQPVQPVSQVPPPIKPVDARRSSSGPVDLYDTDHVSTADWIAARSEQKRQRMKI